MKWLLGTLGVLSLVVMVWAEPPRDRIRVRTTTDVELPREPPRVVRERVYVPVPVQSGGCIGRSAPAGCYGRQAGCIGQTAGCYGNVAYGAPYGARIGPGVYNTPSGRPAAPGIFSAPGAPFPLDGPIRRGIRAGAGYDY